MLTGTVHRFCIEPSQVQESGLLQAVLSFPVNATADFMVQQRGPTVVTSLNRLNEKRMPYTDLMKVPKET